MGRRRAAKWVQLSIGGIILVAVALAVWGFYEERNLGAPNSNGPDASSAARGRSASSSAQLVVADKIGEMRLVSVQQGREAIQQINDIHGHNVGLQAGYIATYEGGGYEASIWVARMASPTEARNLVDQMTGMIRPNKPYFTDLQQVQKEGKIVFSVNSGGQKHYYYQASDKVIWLSVGGADPDSVLQSALAVLN